MLAEGPVLIACEPSAESVLGAVGLSYLAHAQPHAVRLGRLDACQPQLGEQVLALPFDESLVGLARRVYAGIGRSVAHGCGRARKGSCRGCEGGCASRVLFACASDEPEMPQAVLAYARLCFSEGRRVSRMLAHEDVARLEGIARRVVAECEHVRQFARFSQMADGSFVASLSPNANVVPLVGGHFAARMGQDHFCLVDPGHRVACLHEPRSRCQVVRLDGLLAEALARRDDVSSDELAIRELWRTFYHGLTLRGRGPSERGYDLRASWIPRRYLDGLTELA